MHSLMTETERWRSQEVARLNGRIQTIANRRGEVLAPYREARAGTALPQGVRAKLDELDRQVARVRRELHEVEVEARRRETEPVRPDAEIRKLTEQLAHERKRRRWFSYHVHYKRMKGGYRQELRTIERRIAEIATTIEQIEEAESYAAELGNLEKEADA